MNSLWFYVPLLVILYCAWQVQRDYRRGDRVMAALGFACAALLALTPFPGNVVKVTVAVPVADR